MKWISTLFARYWRNVHLSLILLLSMTLIMGGEPITGEVGNVTTAIFYESFAWINDRVEQLQMVNEKNQELLQALVEASSELSRVDEIRRENIRLRRVLGFKPPVGYSMVPVEVISVSGAGIPIAASIRRSVVDSIEINQPLINEQGLVGRVRKVYGNRANVQLLTDPAHRVAARVAESREMGIVKYDRSDGMILDNFPIQGNIEVGDLIITSGLGGVYPDGLIVGTVSSVERPEEGTFCRVLLAPAANFNSLEELFILRDDQVEEDRVREEQVTEEQVTEEQVGEDQP